MRGREHSRPRKRVWYPTSHRKGVGTQTTPRCLGASSSHTGSREEACSVTSLLWRQTGPEPQQHPSSHVTRDELAHHSVPGFSHLCTGLWRGFTKITLVVRAFTRRIPGAGRSTRRLTCSLNPRHHRNNLSGSFSHYPHFTDEKTQAQRLSHLLKSIQLLMAEQGWGHRQPNPRAYMSTQPSHQPHSLSVFWPQTLLLGV